MVKDDEQWVEHKTETKVNIDKHEKTDPVAKLDTAPDYESGDWGFEFLQGCADGRHSIVVIAPAL